MDYEVLVAGSGVAGLTAGLFAARHGRSTVVLGSQPGGALLSITRIDDFPGFPEGVAGYDLGPILQEQALAAGAEFSMSELDGLRQVGGGWEALRAEGPVTARTVILATGTEPRALGLPGEERFAGRGISHCASCDGPLHRQNVVGVVGGGDSALLEALELAQFAEGVVVLHRGSELRAQRVYRDRVDAQPKIQVRLGTVVEEVLGDDRLAGVRVRDAASGDTSSLELGGLFVYVGGRPRSEFLADLGVVDELGHVETDAWMRTALPGLFAAGSLRAHSSGQAVSAAGDGATAAVAAHRYLEAADRGAETAATVA